MVNPALIQESGDDKLSNTVINVDLPWIPAVLEQRISRVHQMGQKRPVQAFLLVTEETLHLADSLKSRLADCLEKDENVHRPFERIRPEQFRQIPGPDSWLIRLETLKNPDAMISPKITYCLTMGGWKPDDRRASQAVRQRASLAQAHVLYGDVPIHLYAALAATRGAGAPCKRPCALRSSSTSGQWIPYPAPAIRQFVRCAGVAWCRRGYHARGTVIVRPS